MNRGDILIGLLADGDAGDDVANELLKEFLRGYPIARLALLLESEDDAVVKAAAWIASELGVAVEPMLRRLLDLLHHRLKYVRFFAVDAVFQSAGRRGEAIADAIQLVDDPESAVRWKVMEKIARADSEQLAAASPYLPSGFARIPLSTMIASDETTLRELLQGSEREQRLAAAFAGRRALQGDPTLAREIAEQSATVTDDAATQLARDLIDYIRVVQQT